MDDEQWNIKVESVAKKNNWGNEHAWKWYGKA